MGRSIPSDENDLLIHPVLSLSLFAAGMAAATFAMITALCSFSRKKTQRNVEEDILQSPATLQMKEESLPPGETDVKTTEEAAAATISNETIAPQESETVDKEKEDGADLINKELPLPPGMKTSGIGAQAVNTWNNANNVNKTTSSQMKKSASERRLLSSLSIKLPRSLSMARKGDKNKEEYSNSKRKNNGRKLSMSSVTSSVTTSMTKQEESIWMKTIILGEKCKVPDEDDDGAVIYDSKGRKIPAYHPKSRQNSFIDQNALPNQNRSRQCSYIDPSAIPDQRFSSATKDGEHHDEMISEDQQELMSLSQL